MIDDHDHGLTGATTHRWVDLLGADEVAPDVDVRPSDLATFIYTGGTTGPSKGCMLSHNYHEALTRQIGICWERTADDVVWTPLPLFHFNAITTAVLGPLVWGGRAAIYRRFSVSNFWSGDEPGRGHRHLHPRHDGLPARPRRRPARRCRGRARPRPTRRCGCSAPRRCRSRSTRSSASRFGIDTFSGAYGVTEASLISWQPPGVRNRPNAAGVINDEYFDVRIFDDDDDEVAAGTEGEIVIRPKRPEVMFEGYWGRPEATVETSRNWWYHTGDIGKVDDDRYLYFVDRKADYLRRRGENISSFEVERVLMGHGALADVAVHAVPSELTEDDLKVTATLAEGATLTEEELFRWCIDELPYFALPALHRVPGRAAAQPRRPGAQARAARRGRHADATWDVETVRHHLREALASARGTARACVVVRRWRSWPARRGRRPPGG